jgi:hypothetical protein
MVEELYVALLARLLPRTSLVEVTGLLGPVLAHEENRTGQNPARVKRNKVIDFIFLTFIDTFSGRY